MAKKLKTEIEHEEVTSKTSPVSLEALLDNNNDPSVVSIHYFKKEFNKNIDDEGLPRYSLGGETITYEFDCRNWKLKRMARYEGNFREKGYRWGENLLKEYLPEAHSHGKTSRLKRRAKRKAYKLVKKIINHLEIEKGTQSLKERKNYDFFIRVLKKIDPPPVQKGKQLNLID